MRIDIVRQQDEDGQINIQNTVQTARDMLVSWRKRIGATTTLSRVYPLPNNESVELTSDNEKHVIAHHTTADTVKTYEFDATTARLVVDIVSNSNEVLAVPPSGELQLYDDLGRLLFEADIQERGH